MEEDIKKQKEALKKFKDFFTSDMKIKETLLELAPTETDDISEESRIEYTDKLYKELKNLEVEFIEMAQNFGNNPEVAQTIKSHFEKAKEAFLIGKYEPGTIQELYRKQFTEMSQKLIEDVKEEFCGYTLYRGNLDKCIKESGSINELLHVFHSYVTNNDRMIQELPVIASKKNSIERPITLYGEETKLSRKLFEEFPIELDCDDTDIVSMRGKILMMVRGRGHALTIDIDTSQKDDILVKYFVPKLCNRDMIEALPGINIKGISENGATGLFQTSSEEMPKKIFDFIEKVPTDLDNPLLYNTPNDIPRYDEKLKENNEKLSKEVIEEYKQDIITERDEKEESVVKTSKFKELITKIKEISNKLKSKISAIFKKNNTPMLNAPREQLSIDVNNEREGFQKELRNGQEKPLTINIENMLEKENKQLTIDKVVEEKGNEAK